MKFHHLGIACEDIELGLHEVKKQFEILGTSAILYDPFLEAQVCLLDVKNGSSIELVNCNAINTFLKKNINFNYPCYETTNFSLSIEKFKKMGAIVITEPKPAIMFNDRLVCFLYTSMGVIEILNYI